MAKDKKPKRKRGANIKFSVVGKEPEHETSTEATKLVEIHPLLPRKIREKYGMTGVIIFAVNDSGVSLLADGEMKAKSLVSMLRALREYEEIISKRIESLVS